MPEKIERKENNSGRKKTNSRIRLRELYYTDNYKEDILNESD